ncbi:MAG: hypothetical protein ABW046_06405 [Actinoplanes sp.]
MIALHRDEHRRRGRKAEREVTRAMNIADRIRRRRLINRQNRAIDRAMMSAPTQAMRDEIAYFAQRKTF